MSTWPYRSQGVSSIPDGDSARKNRRAKPVSSSLGGPAEQETVGAPDSLRVIGEVVFEPLGERLGPIHHEGAVHQKEKLLRHDAGAPLGDGGPHDGKIEQPQELIGAGLVAVAADLGVERTPPAAGDVVHRRPSHLQIQFPSHGQQGVPPRLHVHSPGVHAPEQLVVAVEGKGPNIEPAAHLIGGRGHDQTVQRLERPTRLHEAGSQPVQHLLMGRCPTQRSEVAGRPDQRLAEMMHPDPIDHDPRRQWIGRTGHGLGQLDASASLGEPGRIHTGKNPQESPRRHIPRCSQVSARGHRHVLVPGLCQNMGKIVFGRRSFLEFLDFRLPLLDQFLLLG